MEGSKYSIVSLIAVWHHDYRLKFCYGKPFGMHVSTAALIVSCCSYGLWPIVFKLMRRWPRRGWTNVRPLLLQQDRKKLNGDLAHHHQGLVATDFSKQCNRQALSSSCVKQRSGRRRTRRDLPLCNRVSTVTGTLFYATSRGISAPQYYAEWIKLYIISHCRLPHLASIVYIS
jgi:hypothetical protein